MRLQDKVCTGSANGIGAAAKKFAAEGPVVIVYDLSAEQVVPAVRDIQASGGRAAGYMVNVAERAAVDAGGTAQ